MNVNEFHKIFEMIVRVTSDKGDNESLSHALSFLFQRLEQLEEENARLQAENQRLRDEINRLKGEHGKPDIRGNTRKSRDISSEKERTQREPQQKKSKAKKHNIIIDRVEVCHVDKAELPNDAEFKGYESVIIQEILIHTDNVEYKKEVYYSASEKTCYVGKLPASITGEFGPGVKSLVCTLKHVANMSEPKIAEFFANFGLIISQSTISRILTKEQDDVHQEKAAIFLAGLHSSRYQQIDDTVIRVNGQNQYAQIVSNPYYTAYFTVPHKNRLTVLDILLCGQERTYCFNDEALALLEEFRVSQTLMARLRELTHDAILSESEMLTVLEALFPDPSKGKNTRVRIMEAGAIASYHQSDEIPVVEVLLSDDAPQFKKLTEEQALCWVHEGRHYKKLTPIIPEHRADLENFLERFWEYYGKLVEYKKHPTAEQAATLSVEFDTLFSTPTTYDSLAERIKKSRMKKDELLAVLRYSELPLHNNNSELGARVEKRRQDVSLQLKTQEGTEAKDAFQTITQTARKLGVSAYAYIYDRISKNFSMPSLATLIEQRVSPQIE